MFKYFSYMFYLGGQEFCLRRKKKQKLTSETRISQTKSQTGEWEVIESRSNQLDFGNLIYGMDDPGS